MKPTAFLIPFFGLAILLSGCSDTAETTYDLAINIQDETYKSTLIFASNRVIERRLVSLGAQVQDLDVNRNGDDTSITVKVKEQVSLDALTATLTEKFDLQFMEETTVEEADIVVEGHGAYKKTGLDNTSVEWLSASGNPEGNGSITIQLSDEGRAKMAEIFANNKGKTIGLFVRQRLASKLLVETDEVLDDIVITSIPSAALAEVFADDVNVGLHVTFVPRQ